MTPAILFLPTCRGCSKPRHPREFVGDPATGYCWHCYEWHLQALAVFTSGAAPRACQECGRTYAELERLSGDGAVRFGFHRKDGIYQILGVACGCSASYERKRLDLYGSTPYGHTQKLRGAK